MRATEVVHLQRRPQALPPAIEDSQSRSPNSCVIVFASKTFWHHAFSALLSTHIHHQHRPHSQHHGGRSDGSREEQRQGEGRIQGQGQAQAHESQETKEKQEECRRLGQWFS